MSSASSGSMRSAASNNDPSQNGMTERDMEKIHKANTKQEYMEPHMRSAVESKEFARIIVSRA